jgi:hypothetical protein
MDYFMMIIGIMNGYSMMGLLGFKHPGLDPALGVSGTSGLPMDSRTKKKGPDGKSNNGVKKQTSSRYGHNAVGGSETSKKKTLIFPLLVSVGGPVWG